MLSSDDVFDDVDLTATDGVLPFADGYWVGLQMGMMGLLAWEALTFDTDH